MTEFKSFPPELMVFLDELAENNDRDWFEDNRARYESDVVAPTMEFIVAMGRRLKKISPHFMAIPKKMGGSMMRIYRDVRFSNDKRPYKTNVGIQFRHELAKDVHAPGFYVHLEPETSFVAVGLWRPPTEPLAAIRERVAAEPAAWLQARDSGEFKRRFEIGGESLKTAPRGFEKDHPMIEDLRRKDFIASAERDEEEVEADDFLDRTAADFAAARPFMKFLCKAVGADF